MFPLCGAISARRCVGGRLCLAAACCGRVGEDEVDDRTAAHPSRFFECETENHGAPVDARRRPVFIIMVNGVHSVARVVYAYRVSRKVAARGFR